MKVSRKQLIMRQAMPLMLKMEYTKNRIRQWYDYWNSLVYVSFSGGKDSTVLLHIVRSIFPDVPGVFVDTGLEYPEIRNFVKTIDNVIWLKPKMPFNKVIEKYGYPVISKQVSRYVNDITNGKNNEVTKKMRLTGIKADGSITNIGKLSEKWKFLIDAPFTCSGMCCDVMKKNPIKKYGKESNRKAIVGTMASESSSRQSQYIINGCNAFDLKYPISTPIAFWKEEDIWEYIKQFNVPYSKIYDMGESRTGCMFCMFGVQFEKSDLFNKNRFERMKISHPKQYDYCINKLGCGKVLDYIGINY